MHDCSHNLMQFSEVYRNQSHSSQRGGPIAGSMPSISDVHHAMKFNAKITEALDFALQKLQTDEADRAKRVERASREATGRRPHRLDRVDDGSRVRKDSGDGGLAGPDPKKRRGVCDPSPVRPPPEDCETCVWLMDECSKRAAPPGRCHACNRAETPEWRRGPDGARTLCNACGLRKSSFWCPNLGFLADRGQTTPSTPAKWARRRRPRSSARARPCAPSPPASTEPHLHLSTTVMTRELHPAQRQSSGGASTKTFHRLAWTPRRRPPHRRCGQGIINALTHTNTQIPQPWSIALCLAWCGVDPCAAGSCLVGLCNPTRSAYDLRAHRCVDGCHSMPPSSFHMYDTDTNRE